MSHIGPTVLIMKGQSADSRNNLVADVEEDVLIHFNLPQEPLLVHVQVERKLEAFLAVEGDQGIGVHAIKFLYTSGGQEIEFQEIDYQQED